MFDLSMGVTGYDIFIFLTHVKIFTKRTVGTAYLVIQVKHNELQKNE